MRRVQYVTLYVAALFSGMILILAPLATHGG